MAAQIVFSVFAPFVIAGSFVLCKRLIRALLKNDIATIRVSSSGIQRGGHWEDWEDVAWIGGMRTFWRPWLFRLVYQPRSASRRHVTVLPLRQPMNRTELGEVLRRLEVAVVPHHPELVVGGRIASPYLPGSVELLPPP